jgi:hypothetical protein
MKNKAQFSLNLSHDYSILKEHEIQKIDKKIKI